MDLRAPIVSDWPPKPLPDSVVPAPRFALAVGSPASACFAIATSPTRLVHASPTALALFGAKDLAALGNRLLTGAGPNARRLRHLAATLPIGESPRLERMLFFVGRRRVSVNLRCARVVASGAAPCLVVSATDRDPGSAEPVAPDQTRLAPPKTRFLWSLDEQERFGDIHPALSSAFATNAPQPGETAAALIRRTGLEPGERFAELLAKRQTFSDFAIDWPLAGLDRRRTAVLSAAPLFDRGRVFAGYRGFGALGEEFAAPNPRGLTLAPSSHGSSLGGQEAREGDDGARGQTGEGEGLESSRSSIGTAHRAQGPLAPPSDDIAPV